MATGKKKKKGIKEEVWRIETRPLQDNDGGKELKQNNGSKMTENIFASVPSHNTCWHKSRGARHYLRW